VSRRVRFRPLISRPVRISNWLVMFVALTLLYLYLGLLLSLFFKRRDASLPSLPTGEVQYERLTRDAIATPPDKNLPPNWRLIPFLRTSPPLSRFLAASPLNSLSTLTFLKISLAVFSASLKKPVSSPLPDPPCLFRSPLFLV